METIAALILRIISNPLTNVFQKKLTEQKVSSLTVNLATYIILSIICLLWSLRISWGAYPVSVYFFAIAGGLAGALGNICLIKAIACGDLSVLAPVNSYKSIAAMIMAIFLVHEIPSIAGFIGMVLIIWGSYFVLNTLEEGFSWRIFQRKDILLRIAATVLSAADAVLTKRVIIESSAIVSFTLWCWFGLLFSLMLIKLFRHNTAKPAGNYKYYLAIALCMGIMQLCTVYVFENMNVSYALALFQLSILLSVIFGWKFFNEKNLKEKLLGSVIMITGSMLIILGL